MDTQTIQTPLGQYVGQRSGALAVFRGIPYAESPTGPRRWRAPQPVRPAAHSMQALHFGAACMQPGQQPGSFYEKEFFSQPVLDGMDENCLFLNLWKPAAAQPGDNLPVAVWLHGGGFVNGCGHEPEFDGAAYCREGVILVTLNYRLNVFGYFAHPWLSAEDPDGVSGNYALQDQLCALRWVQLNIAAFGGDAGKVTLMGQSAGARSVQAICGLPQAEGLFSKAIMQSGAGMQPQKDALPLTKAEEVGLAFTQKAGIGSLEALRAMPARALMRQYLRFLEEDGLGCRLVLDGVHLPMPQARVVRQGVQHHIPYLLGTNSEEMATIFPGQPSGAAWEKDALAWANACAAHQTQPVYAYRFQRQLPGDGAGAFHSAELWYMFGSLSHCWRPFTSQDEALAAKMVQYWTAFIKTGIPGAPGLPPWQPYTPAGGFVMRFG